MVQGFVLNLMAKVWHHRCPRPDSKAAHSIQNNFAHQIPWKKWAVNSLRSFIQKHSLKYNCRSLLAVSSLLRQSPVEGWRSGVPACRVLLVRVLPGRTELRACIRFVQIQIQNSPSAPHLIVFLTKTFPAGKLLFWIFIKSEHKREVCVPFKWMLQMILNSLENKILQHLPLYVPSLFGNASHIHFHGSGVTLDPSRTIIHKSFTTLKDLAHSGNNVWCCAF